MSKDIEKKFKKVYHQHIDSIDKQLDIASKAISAAMKIAEEHGIPFYASVSPLGQSYMPLSFEEKWADLPSHTLEDLEIYCEYGGWQHSDVC